LGEVEDECGEDHFALDDGEVRRALRVGHDGTGLGEHTLERGIGLPVSEGPGAWAPAMAREDGTVDREVARRLIPLDELEEWAAQRTASDMTTTVLDVAEQFDTTEELAELAMLLVKGDSCRG
jgi:hypothetical protein